MTPAVAVQPHRRSPRFAIAGLVLALVACAVAAPFVFRMFARPAVPVAIEPAPGPQARPVAVPREPAVEIVAPSASVPQRVPAAAAVRAGPPGLRKAATPGPAKPIEADAVPAAIGVDGLRTRLLAQRKRIASAPAEAQAQLERNYLDLRAAIRPGLTDEELRRLATQIDTFSHGLDALARDH